MDQLIQQVTHIFQNQKFDVLAFLDILILVLLIYGLLSILRGTRAEVLVRGLIILFGLAFIIVNIWPQFTVLKWLVNNSLQFIIFAVIVIFAPEMRRALEQIGHTGDFFNRPLGGGENPNTRSMIEEVVSAAFYLSNQRWGGLIVIERETGLSDIANKGVPIGGQVTSQLLVNIFVPNTPLHDGAVIIRQNEIVAAKVILPLSENLSKYEHYGTRHKAALGISEQSDAIIVVVSEETGQISVAYHGKLQPKLDRERLRATLAGLLEPSSGRIVGRIRRRAGRLKTLETGNGTKQPVRLKEEQSNGTATQANKPRSEQPKEAAGTSEKPKNEQPKEVASASTPDKPKNEQPKEAVGKADKPKDEQQIEAVGQTDKR
ncbi:MAG TPA: diadenylate cyclase CdaA [Chloroflexia bacterium]|nr:diadenylate cyclase CdaA [Chloroflexia bacterium]